MNFLLFDIFIKLLQITFSGLLFGVKKKYSPIADWLFNQFIVLNLLSFKFIHEFDD